MKALHHPSLFCWSVFDEARNLDFNSYFWRRDGGNVIVDPLKMSPHDLAHATELGGAAVVVISNSDHVRDAAAVAKHFGAQLLGPRAEQGTLPFDCDRWLADGDEVVAGMTAYEMHGSKTPGELVLKLGEDILISGDLVRVHQAGRLTLLPEPKLTDLAQAQASVRRLAAWPRIETVLVGDGYPIFRDGHARLQELLDSWPAAAT